MNKRKLAKSAYSGVKKFLKSNAGKHVKKNAGAAAAGVALGKAIKYMKSRTQTKRKKHVRSSYPDDWQKGRGFSKHYIRLCSKAMSRYKIQNKKYSKAQYIQQNSNLVSTVSGTQTIFHISTDLSSHQIGDNGVVADPPPNKYYYGLSALNPNYKDSGTSIAGNVGAGAVGQNSRIFVDYITYDLQFVNSCTIPVELVIYGVVNRKSNEQFGYSRAGAYDQLTAGPLKDIDNCLLDTNSGWTATANQASDAAGIQLAATFGKLTSKNTYGFTPFELQAFRKIYKGVFKRKIELAAGASHKMAIKICVKKWFSEAELLEQSLAGVYTIPYSTFSLFGVLRGSPVVVKDAGGVPYVVNEAVTMGSAEVGWTSERRVQAFYGTGSTNDAVVGVPSFRSISGSTSAQHISNVDTQIGEILVG